MLSMVKVRAMSVVSGLLGLLAVVVVLRARGLFGVSGVLVVMSPPWMAMSMPGSCWARLVVRV